MRDIAVGYFAANYRAADDFAMVDDRRNDDDFKAVLRAELHEQRSVAGLFMAEAEVFANEERAEAKLVDENLLHEFFGRQARKLQSKSLDDGGFEANHAEPCGALLVR